MGLISPLVLKGKQILQKVVASEQLWDQLMCPDDKRKWEDWRTEITNLTALSIPRCFKTETNIVSTELHHFSDASLNGYGACSYIKQVNDSGKILCNLILAKSQVAPLKKPTIPRLELQGAVTATRLANVLRKELKLSVDKETFWSDSQIVLGYISNDVRKFHLYVANRVSEIRKTTEPKQWNYVPTEFNPADIVSRGISAKEIIDNDMWWNRPPFLRDSVALDFNKQNWVNTTVNESDPEVQKKGLVTMATFNTPSITRKFTRFSSWKKLVHSIALLKSFVKQKQWMYKELKTNDLKEAEALILKMAQAESYPMKEKEKSLIKLNPKIDDEGIVRVGGRASASTLSYQQKYPIIIPKNSHLAYLLTVRYHKQISHLGKRSTLAAIRDAGIWMVNGSGVVKRVLNQCVGCARLRKAPETQLMGELLKERMEATPPFTNIGIDTFGPYYVKDKRTELKRWGLLITCLYSRAVHIKVLDDMSADTLIQALRYFMALRGPVQTIYCGNGTNFFGVKNEIEKQPVRKLSNTC
ncbi:uncharacterized protein [Watersipora subatra]|uniref:uncharacterized protein n=1 Tax=Watersipora subatra TaxID=2589382 RepID=UPI00355ADB58